MSHCLLLLFFKFFIDGSLQGLVASGEGRTLVPGAAASSNSDCDEHMVRLKEGGWEMRKKIGKSSAMYRLAF